MVSVNKIIEALYNVVYIDANGEKSRLPVILMGNPGVGKTKSIESFAKKNGLFIKTLNANKVTEVELQGLPFIAGTVLEWLIKTFLCLAGTWRQRVAALLNMGKDAMENGRTISYFTPKFIKELNKNPNGILFVDEITTASESMQPMFLSAIQDGNFNEFTIPKTVFRVCAGNYSNIAGVKRMNAALMNRGVIFNVKPTWADTREGYLSRWVYTGDDKPATVNTDDEAALSWVKYAHIIDEFFSIHDNDVVNQPPEIIDEKNMAYPTSRSIDYLTSCLAYLDKNDDEFVLAIITGLIGNDMGKLFFRFMKDKDDLFAMPLTDFVGREDEFDLPDPDRHDEAFWVINAICTLLVSDKDKYYDLLVAIINNLQKHGYVNMVTPRLVGAFKMLSNSSADEFSKFKGDKGLLVKDMANRIDNWNELFVNACTRTNEMPNKKMI